MINLQEYAEICDCDIDLNCLLGEVQALTVRINQRYKDIRTELFAKEKEKIVSEKENNLVKL